MRPAESKRLVASGLLFSFQDRFYAGGESPSCFTYPAIITDSARAVSTVVKFFPGASIGMINAVGAELLKELDEFFSSCFLHFNPSKGMRRRDIIQLSHR